MKRYLLRAVKLLCFALAVALCVGVLQENLLCHADHNRQRVKGFYEEDKQSLDVVYMGASEVYSDIAPGYAYERDGVTSYIFATQANSILNYKSQLKNVLSRQNPSMIVIELNGAVYGDEEEVTKEANLHNYGDNVPLDITKLEWVAQNIRDNKAEYLFPIIKYHGVWTDLSADQKYRRTIRNDQIRGYNYLKGMLNWPIVFRSPKPSLNSKLAVSADQKAPITGIEETALRELLAYCRDQKLENVVFARFPHIVTEKTFERYKRSNTVADIVAEYGFDYLNFERDVALTGLDEEKDYYNDDHLNIYGQQKFTAYLTDYLKEHYALAPHTLSDAQKEEWELCADYYEAYYSYNEALIEEKDYRELSEDWELIEALQAYLPQG